MSQPTITLHGRRGDEWEQVLGTRTLPVQQPRVQTLQLQGIGWANCWMLDFDALPLPQQAAIVEHFAAKACASVPEVAKELITRGVPIRDGSDIELNEDDADAGRDRDPDPRIDMRMLL